MIQIIKEISLDKSQNLDKSLLENSNNSISIFFVQFLSQLLNAHMNCINALSHHLEIKLNACFGFFNQPFEITLDKVKKCREQISCIKETWRPYIQERENQAFYQEVKEIFKSGHLKRVEEGAGATYFLLDALNNPQFVIKPIDEEILCINNRKGMASVEYQGAYVRWGIPLYRSAQTDTAVSKIAHLIGIDAITPKTEMIILKSDDFYDFTDKAFFTQDEKDEIQALTGALDKERLCSIQRFVPNAKELAQVLYPMQEYSDEEIEKHIDQGDFERVNFLMQVIGETDGHFYNILAYVKDVDQDGKPIWGLQKIDHCLSLPEGHSTYYNLLDILPNSYHPYSEEMKELIKNFPEEDVEKVLKELGLEKSMSSLKERVQIVKQMAENDASIKEINEKIESLNIW